MEKISSGNLYPFGTQRPKRMKTFDFPHETIPHTIKDPHSKALKSDCLCPRAPDYDTASKGSSSQTCGFHVFVLIRSEAFCQPPRADGRLRGAPGEKP